MQGILVDKDVFDARMKVCEACEFYSKLGTCGHYPNEPVRYKGKRYRLCGCPMKVLKGRMALSSCPVGKWGGRTLKVEKLAAIRQFLAKWTDENGHPKNTLDGAAASALWYDITGERASGGCSGCIKEIIHLLQRYLKEQTND